MKGPARWIALVTILGVIAAACSGDGGDSESPSAGSSVEPAKGGTLHIGVSSEPASAAMDPAKEYYSLSWEQMRCCLLRTLYSTNGQALAQGGLELARTWRLSPRGLRGRLDLHDSRSSRA